MLLPNQFQWSAERIIILNIELGRHCARALFDPGCSGVAILQAWADQRKIVPTNKIPITIASNDYITTISRDVLDLVRIKWKDLKISFPDIILTGA